MLSTEIILLQVVVAYSKSLHCFSVEGGTELSLLWVHLEHLLRGSVSFSEFPGWELTMGIVEATLLSSGLLSLWTLGIECGAKFSFLWIHLENLLWSCVTFSELTRWEFTMSVVETTLITLSVESGGKFTSLWIHLKNLLWGIITFGKLTRWEFTMSIIETTLLSCRLLTFWSLGIEGGAEFSFLWVHLKNLLWCSITFSKLARWELTMSVVKTTFITLSVKSGGKFSFLWIHLKDLLWGIVTFSKLTGWELTMGVVETSLLSSGLLTLWLWALSIEGGGELSFLWVHLEYLFWGSISWCEHA